MAKPKRSPLRPAAGSPVTNRSAGVESAGLHAANDPGSVLAPDHCPSPLAMKLVSAIIAVHLSLIAVSYSATVAASAVQRDVLAACGPYLAALHFDAQQLPLGFSTSSAREKAHQLMQTASSRPGDEDWSMIAGSGIRGGDRQRRWQRWLSATAELGENEEGVLAAWLMLPVAKQHPQASQLRIDRQPDAMTNPADVAKRSPYQASIIREADGAVRLVQVPPPRLTAPATETAHD